MAETCDLCGSKTAYDGTRVCSPCWELRYAFKKLKTKSPERAEKWLRRSLREIQDNRVEALRKKLGLSLGGH